MVQIIPVAGGASLDDLSKVDLAFTDKIVFAHLVNFVDHQVELAFVSFHLVSESVVPKRSGALVLCYR